MLKPIKILILEDLPSDAELAQRQLKKHLGESVIRIVDSRDDFINELNNFEPDLIVSDYNLPSFDGLSALKLTLEKDPSIPFIILTGSMNEDTAVECMKAGAWDYVIKEHNKRLGTSAISALEKRRVLDEKAKVSETNRENQIFIQQITRTIPLFLFIFDLSSNQSTYSNRDIWKALGYESLNKTQNEGHFLLSIIHEEDVTSHTNLFNRLRDLKEGEVESNEYRVKDASGEWVWFRSMYVVFSFDDSGKPLTILESTQDITSLKKTQRDLREAHKFYKQILDSTQDGIVVANLENKIVFWNPPMTEMFNMDYLDVLGKDLEDIFSKIGRESELPLLEQSKLGHIVTTPDYIFNYKSTGKTGWANGRYFPLLDTNNDFSGVIYMAHDITKRKLDEVELRESEHKYKTIFENIQDVYFETDMNGIIVEISPSLNTISGYTREEMIGKFIGDVYADLDVRNRLLQRLKNGERLKDYEILLLDKDGTQRDCAVTAQILLDKKDNKPHVYGIMRDISERKRITSELIQAKEKAEEMSKLKSAFLANMSHELRTPLVGILGFAELLNDMVPDSEIKEMVETILESGERLHTTLNLILDLSRVEANRQEIKWTKVDFVYRVNENIRIFEGLAQKKGLSLKLNTEYDKLICDNDSYLLDHILSNVINNAIKYTETGYIKVDLSKEIIDELEYAVIQVTDTGIGIDECRQELIFDAFRQASEGYHRMYEGTGLGLTITKKYVELLNGRIYLKSALNQGSTFTIQFPVHRV